MADSVGGAERNDGIERIAIKTKPIVAIIHYAASAVGEALRATASVGLRRWFAQLDRTEVAVAVAEGLFEITFYHITIAVGRYAHLHHLVDAEMVKVVNHTVQHLVELLCLIQQIAIGEQFLVICAAGSHLNGGII